MRIIKEGQRPIKEWQVTCKKCGCVFVFNNSDVHSDQIEGDWVVCPTCKECIDVTHRSWLNENIKSLQNMDMKDVHKTLDIVINAIQNLKEENKRLKEENEKLLLTIENLSSRGKSEITIRYDTLED